MTLPDTFQFSQHNLQDYVECPRRFQLRYVLMQPWPALITGEPQGMEQQIQRGADFHHLAHQHTLGLPAVQLEETIHDERLLQWWHTYLTRFPADLPTAVRRPELLVTAPLFGYRLMAKFDFLAVEPGQRLVILDWKTVRKRPSRASLSQRLQTRVYRYLAVEACAAFNDGQRPRPEQVEMIYWFAQDRGNTERFAYNTAVFSQDRDYLTNLISESTSRQESVWPLTPNERLCRFCDYRSLCERQIKPGFLGDLDDDPQDFDLEIDLEQIAEIEF
jgi:CRISPR/Cas system-associated exonuclease Cas4 (RecB family)